MMMARLVERSGVLRQARGSVLRTARPPPSGNDGLYLKLIPVALEIRRVPRSDSGDPVREHHRNDVPVVASPST